ncbi:hypothetical protein CVT26_004036 [Gymnopilus dilepis]|uniref:F-box domain-containing protein n=1 Tax=Gymnopilus dilepis TaxID=231916 RepID=A0A409WPI9_9AGAR|nr:hypothetical protein CVT26_004036 [Gymnopilus dilepis]
MGCPLEYESVRGFSELKPSPLDTTLISACVCQRWRSLLLQWPFIWGRCLHLNRLCRLREEGRKEVVRRTGSSPLCIIGYIDFTGKFVSRFLTGFLHANWQRVQRLCMHHDDARSHDLFQWGIPMFSLHAVFTHAAPILETFIFDTSGASGTLPLAFPSVAVRLFGGSAPRLRSLRCSAMSLKTSDITGAQWLRQLQALHLMHTKVKPAELVEIINKMPGLESLRFFSVDGKGELIDTVVWDVDSIHLPRLVDLWVSYSFFVDLALIRIIKPSRYCTLSGFNPKLWSDEMAGQEDVIATVEALGRYLDRYLSFWTVESLLIVALQDGQFELSVQHASCSQEADQILNDLDPHPNPYLEIGLSSLTRHPMLNVDPIFFLVALLKPHLAVLSSVQNLTFQVSLSDNTTSQYLVAELGPVIAALEGVLSLCTYDTGLRTIGRFQPDDINRFFPRLREISIIHTLQVHDLSADEFEPILAKILSRRNAEGNVWTEYPSALKAEQAPFTFQQHLYCKHRHLAFRSLGNASSAAMSGSESSNVLSEPLVGSDLMYTQRQLSPISKLNQDVLWLIFMLNTEMINSFGDVYSWAKSDSEISVLDTTLISSHVCQGWRSLLLKWPVIWGRSLHLDRLFQLGEEGWKEIIRRTRTAPLFIVGYIDFNIEFAAQVVTHLLRANWKRVQKLCVHFSHIPSPELVEVFVWDAPILETFALEKSYPALAGLPALKGEARLFKGSAPHLRFLSSSAVAFDMANFAEVTWLGQLRTLNLADMTINPTELVVIIAHMQRLESLYLRWPSWIIQTIDAKALEMIEQHSINLPHLVNFRISHSFRIDLAFIHIIKPSKHCTLTEFSPICRKRETVNQGDIVATIKALLPYVDRYFSFWTIREVSISAGQDLGFHFGVHHSERLRELHRLLKDTKPDPRPNFTINLSSLMGFPIRPGVDPVSCIVTLLKPHLANLSSVQNLTFNIFPRNDSWMDLEFIALVAAFRGVESLTIGYSSLEVLDRYQVDNTKMFFPQLRRLKIIRSRIDGPISAEAFELILKNYFSRRDVAGVPPIRALDFDVKPLGDWSFLDKLTGLKLYHKPTNNTTRNLAISLLPNLLRHKMPIPEDGGSAPESVMDSDHAIIQQRSSPISELHEDILWLIFLLNSDMGNSLEDVNFWAETETEISALDTTLISSRVCRRWRSLLLDWPVIWGRSLHLWRLCQLGKDGSKEVIRRTGAAPLCLVGYVDPSSEFNSQTFTPLVQANWWRIQIFCVCTIHDSDIPSPDWFQVFVQSAPLLEIFALQKTYDGKGMPLSASGHEAQLFNGFAPRLRFLCCTALALQISNVSQASWLGQLRVLKLSDLDIDPVELVDVLKRTHLLESLYIRWFPLSLGQANAGALERHIINLPRLVNLRISHSFHVDLAFIRIIRPSIHCSLFSFLPDRLTSKAETISRDDMMVAFEVLKPYIDGYLAFFSRSQSGQETI